ncbi:MAG: glycosyltransferase family 4 protein [Candidatus Paceibacterota bacterium]|jgi:glycosyltransferase involved in cell wall biosynthesis
MKKKVYYVANFYMPYEKAYGIQVAKMCEALVEAGVDITLIVPSRGPQGSLKKFYGLRVEIPTLWLPTLDLEEYDRFGYVFMALTFSISYFFFLWYKWLLGERFVLYTIDADQYSSSALALIPVPLFSEMHGGKLNTCATRLLFSRLRGVMAINRIIISELKDTFPHSPARYIAEPNGVDLAMFSPQEKSQARIKLGLSLEEPIMLYIGRFYEWKGLEIIPRAAALSPMIRWQMVGDTRERFADVVKESLPENLHFAGGRPYGEMPTWIAAADAVLVLGTKRDEQSYRWTSPMKLFECLATGRPIVASATPAIKDAIATGAALLYEPDNAEDLADKARQAVTPSAQTIALVNEALHIAPAHTWSGRAKRVVHFIESTLNEHIS